MGLCASRPSAVDLDALSIKDKGDLSFADSAADFPRTIPGSPGRDQKGLSGAIAPGQGPDLTAEVKREYAEQDAMGVPYNVWERGPPLPPCNKERVEYMRSLGTCFDVPPDPQVEHMITLMCQVFSTSAALMALVDSDRIYIRNAQGFQQGDFPWRLSFCAWSLAPPGPETLIVEDALLDARFKDNKMVVEHGVRFYCGTPLMGSNGHRLGTLCFVDDKPRKMEAHECIILSNLAEMVVRELERDLALQAAKKSNDRLMLRALDCFEQGVCFVDTAPVKWQAMHSNAVLAEKVGVPQEEFAKQLFWDLFDMPSARDGTPWLACRDVASRGGEFVIHGVRVRGAPERGPFTMRFRSAGKDALDENTPLVGAPSVARYVPDSTSGFYFAIVTQELSPVSSGLTLGSPNTGSSRGELGNLMPDAVPFEDLELGPLLGRGSFGRVYRGTWEGSHVAVKICGTPSGNRSGVNYVPAWKSVEAVLGRKLEHPNIVRTFKHCTVLVQGEETQSRGTKSDTPSGDVSAVTSATSTLSAGSTSSGEAEVETWMIMEYCDKGSLQGAIDRGWFRTPRAVKDGKPHLPSILAIASDVSSAMAYLHEAGIVHGDLCGGNILLASDDYDGPGALGFVAKVADFGMSRELLVASRIETTTYGTVTHMPPELLAAGQMGTAADVYSFGVILNELYCGVRAWASMAPPQILHAVAVQGRKPQFPPGAPPHFVALANACMDANPEQRPSFAEIEPMIEALSRDFLD